MHLEMWCRMKNKFGKCLLLSMKNCFTSNPQDQESVARFMEMRVSPLMSDILVVDFTKEEIKVALVQMHPTKTPRVDGTLSLVYQKLWNIAGEDI